MPSPAPFRLAHAPRLTIAHIMLTTGVTALVMAVLSQLVGTHERQQVWPLLLIAVLASLIGWIYAATLVILWHGLRRTLWRLEPGEWMILCLANVATMWIGIVVLETAVHGWNWLPSHPMRYSILRFAERVLPAEMAMFWLVGAWTQRRQRWWSGAMVAATIIFLSFYIIFGRDSVSPTTFMLLHWLLSVTVVVCVAAGVHDDRSQGMARHWIHWSGAVISGLASLGFVVMSTLALILRW